MKLPCISLTIVVSSFLFAQCFFQQSHNSLQYVDPLIGSGGHGHVFVGTSLPHGMIQLGPNNLTKGWDWCSGYHDSDSTIVGFAHTHLSGTGIADLGDVVLMPVTDDVSIKQSNFYSTFKKQHQTVKPNYYSVVLDKYQIKVELTATERVGFHRYHFPKNKTPHVIIDLQEGVKSLESRKGTLHAQLVILNDSTLVGYRISDEWAKDHRVYFAARFNHSFVEQKIYRNDSVVTNTKIEGENVKACLTFPSDMKSLLAKVAISYTSIEGAMKNLDADNNEWKFDNVVEQGEKIWNHALAVIDYQGQNDIEMKLFYTALYHTMIVPSLFVDVDGAYRGADGQIRIAKNFVPYSVFSLWDTYRSVHPLYTLIDTKNADYVNSLLTITQEQGRLPVWHLVGNETDCMVGVHAIPVIVDACLKDIEGIDKQKAYDAVRKFIDYHQEGLDDVRTKGYIPADKIYWSVAKALEYCIDDYSIAQLALNIGDTLNHHKFLQRSKLYKNYFDKERGFMRGKLLNGQWRTPFDPYHSVHLEDDYIEGNAWQYTWLVPHDVEGLMILFGGKEGFLHKFDSLFTVSSKLNAGASVDITGMIGQYAHGNEPSHHILYLYTLAEKPHRTAELIQQVYQQFYHAKPNGLIGNEDCGQMSAWYLFSSLGFYPVNPVAGQYVFGLPRLEKATLTLNNGKKFTIKTNKEKEGEQYYIRSITLNGKPYTKSTISHIDIMDGGELVYELTTQKP